MPKSVGKIFSNKKFGTRFHKKLVLIMELE
jgi:hypothetical protein